MSGCTFALVVACSTRQYVFQFPFLESLLNHFSQVTLGMVLIRAISIFRGILLFIAQMVGAIVAAFVVQALFTGKLNVSTSLSPTTTIAQGVVIEMLLTSQLVFTIFMLAAEKHVGNFIAPLGIGLSLFIAELTGKASLLPKACLQC